MRMSLSKKMDLSFCAKDDQLLFQLSKIFEGGQKIIFFVILRDFVPLWRLETWLLHQIQKFATKTQRHEGTLRSFGSPPQLALSKR